MITTLPLNGTLSLLLSLRYLLGSVSIALAVQNLCNHLFSISLMLSHRRKFLLFALLLIAIPWEGAAQYRQHVSVKFMGLSIHPLGAGGNVDIMPNKLDKNGYLVMNLGAMCSYEYFLFRDIVSLKYVQGLYADCAARFAGFSGLGIRARIFQWGKHRLSGGIGPTLLYRRNWFELAGYHDTGYFKGSKEDRWQYKFLWYGGEFEYKVALTERWDVATTFVPGYPDLMCLAVGVSYKW